jgi:hypothetical protein
MRAMPLQLQVLLDHTGTPGTTQILDAAAAAAFAP